jgi:hypothetical protein
MKANSLLLLKLSSGTYSFLQGLLTLGVKDNIVRVSAKHTEV